MPNGNVQNAINAFENALGELNPAFGVIPVAGGTFDKVAYHDFAFYDFLLRTDTGYGGAKPAAAGLSAGALAYLDQVEQRGASTEMLVLLANFLTGLETAVMDAAIFVEGALAGEYLLTSLYNDVPAYVGELFELYLLAGPMRQAFLADLRASIIDELTIGDRDGYLFNWETWHEHATEVQFSQQNLHNLGEEVFELITHHAFLSVWRALEQDDQSLLVSSDYNFEVFPYLSVNFGLRLVYRQDWSLCGTQKGEVIKTIPLAPGQKVQVRTKVVRHAKSTNTTVSATESESTRETADSTKGSNEIVSEAAKTFNWKVDAEVHGGIGFIGGSISGSVGGSSDDRSKSTSSNLSEAMEKTASKIRRETKVEVTTETEESTEGEQSSEISNTNNEIAVTYQFHKLQQQYEVFSYLSQVDSVIFVAESLPSPPEINEVWVRQYDWILARVLKDESHRAALNDLSQDIDEDDPTDGAVDRSNHPDNPFFDSADKATSEFASFTQAGSSGNQGSVIPGLSIPDIYAQPQQVYRQYLEGRVARKKIHDLRQIRRSRLYQHIRDNILYYCQAIWRAEDSDQRLLRYKREGRVVPIEWSAPLVAHRVGSQSAADLQFSPTGVTAPLWQLIDPTGPLDYVGNYAVFPLRSLPDQNGGANPRLIFNQPVGQGVGPAVGQPTIVLTLNQVLAEMRGAYVDQDGDLHDPALNVFLAEAQQKTALQLRTIKDEKVADVASYLPAIADQLIDAQNGKVIRRPQAPNELQCQLTADQWAWYLYLKNGTRRFIVDSNNLYLSLFTGEGAALEPYKRAWRYIDVLQAAEDLRASGLKNERRAALLNNVGEFDPDISKVIIASSGALEAALDGAASDALNSNRSSGSGRGSGPGVSK